MDLISIIIPIYKVQEYLRQCLDSVVNQTYKNLEIILVDDGSPDNSGQICDEYAQKDKRIKVIHKKNGGVSDARNSGLSIATGQYITFVDPDDWLELDMYEKMLKKQKELNVDLVRCGCYFEYIDKIEKNDYGYKRGTSIDLQSNKEQFINKFFESSISTCLWLFLIKRSALQILPKFNSELVMGEDLVYVIELLFSSSSLYMYDEYLYHYRINMNGACLSDEYIIRNLKNIFILNGELKKTLKKYECNNKMLYESAVKYCFNLIYYKTTKMNCNSKRKEMINYILNNEQMKSINMGINKNKLTTGQKIFLYLTNKKYYIMLNCFCYVKNLIK